MQTSLLEKARAFRDAHTFPVASYADFKQQLDAQGGFYVAPWCQEAGCEAKVKEDTKATIRCLPLDDQDQLIAETGPCMACASTKSPRVRAIFARAY
jgi:prolyl-tRNA synthetase